jgi:cobalt-zinc-cadmium efflux system outer membrane protein
MKKVFFLPAFIACFYFSKAQEVRANHNDTLQLTLAKAESLFLNNNLDLIAQKLSIDSARATVITARLFDNPQFDYNNGFYNAETHHFFDQEISVQVSQLFRLAGKRKKSMALATSGIDIASFQFYDLLRTLRYALRSDFYNIYFLSQSSGLYDLEISSLKKIVEAYQEQEKKGYTAPVEVLRIQSQLYTLQAEYANLQSNIDNIEAELKLLLHSDPQKFIKPELPPFQNVDLQKNSYQELLDSALANRPDLKTLNASITYSKYNLSLQKALAKPDLTVIAGYDRLGSYVPNYNSIGIAIPLPFFNRNQGNIKNAEIQEQVNKVEYESGLERVKSEVTTNYITGLRAENLLQGIDPGFENKMKEMVEQVTTNFEKKNISLLQFLDFYDSYKQNSLQLNGLRYDNINALEQLNYSIGKIFFNQ